MNDPVAHWHAEHAHYARLLDILEREVAAFHAGNSPDYALMRDVVRYLRYFPDRFHHPREDEAFRRLAARDPDLSLPLNRLLQEHRVIAEAGDQLLWRLEQVAEDVVVSRAIVESMAATYLVYYRHHIATEEREVLPRADELLAAPDWSAVAAAAPEGRDPLFGDDCAPRYRELRRRIAQEMAQAAREAG
ncbi:MAG TPA: hemerythrin domain-containing protein [Burkholderiales bacterium]|nr:hemerythrin domain-containing protein [Burkholderiales bacterium]